MSGAFSYRICSRCVMDSSDEDITFDAEGLCSHCLRFDTQFKDGYLNAQRGEKRAELDRLVARIKAEGKGKPYDCVAGISGGVDSSYICYLLKQLGLRALLVHCDTGWNSELAVSNIEHIVKKLGFDLHTTVIDWGEMQDVQRAFFEASLANCDVPQDHAIFAVLWRTAARLGIKHIITGSNIATESILPISWGYQALDLRHVKSVHRRFGRVALRTFPTLPFWKLYFLYPFVYRIRNVKILNYVPYVKAEAKEVLQRELGWRDYAGKHYESLFTRFFQSYYLVKKFGYDKRRAHYASLVVAGQMSRDEALAQLQHPAYDEQIIEKETEFMAKKLGIGVGRWQAIMDLPKKTYRDYPSNAALFALKDAAIRKIKTLKHRR